MKRSAYSAAATRGFTLIELLVVISIIALLVTGAFGAYGFVMEKAKKAEAQSTAMTVYTAVDQYHREYDYLPQPSSATKGTDCDSDTSAEELLITILLGKDETQNSRRTNFLGDIKDASNKNGKYLGGMVREAESNALVDPWGSHYKVRLDLDLDEKVENPNDEDAASGTKEVNKQCIVWSIGKDLDSKTWKDNVATWGSN